jgi:hypothetical protein
MKKTLAVTDVVTTTCPFELRKKIKTGFPKPDEFDFDFEFLEKLNPELEIDQGIALHKLVEARLKGLTHLIDVTPEWNEINKVSARYAAKIKGFAKKAELHIEELDFMTFSDGYAEIELAFKPDVWWVAKDELYIIDLKRPLSWDEHYLLQLRTYTALVMLKQNLKKGHFLCLNENDKSVWTSMTEAEAKKEIHNIESLCLAAVTASVERPTSGCESCTNICDSIESWAIFNRKNPDVLTQFWANSFISRSSNQVLKTLKEELLETYPELTKTRTTFNNRDEKLIENALIKYEELAKKPSLHTVTKEECIELGLNPDDYTKEIKSPLTPPFKWGI